MKLIGRIADNTTETSARVILLKDLEAEIPSEELVLIKNGNRDDQIILGVLREGLGRNEFLSHTSYRPEVAYMKHGGEPSGVREVYSFSVQPLGVVNEGGLKPNRKIIQPRSPVYLLEEHENPFIHIARDKDVIWSSAYLDGHKSWKIPVRKSYIPYHIGVYGSTGSGKSWFTRNVLIPLYQEAGYKILILDWSGRDYVPYFKDGSISIKDIALDEEVVLEYMSEKSEGFAKNENVRYAFDEFFNSWSDKVKKKLEQFSNDRLKVCNSLYEELKLYVDSYVKRIDRVDWRNAAIRAMNRVFRKIKQEDLIEVMGTRTPREVFAMLGNAGILAIDMSGLTVEAKLSVFLAISKFLYSLMEAGNELNVALIIEEAPQYAPWSPEGMQKNTTEMIKNLAALGRKRKLSITLISQGIRGEIGINASVRRNLNTHFFGRIHPLDASGEGGALEWLSPYGIKAERLLQLDEGKFYFSGVMSYSPVPLLITYEPKLL